MSENVGPKPDRVQSSRSVWSVRRDSFCRALRTPRVEVPCTPSRFIRVALSLRYCNRSALRSPMARSCWPVTGQAAVVTAGETNAGSGGLPAESVSTS
ncbi:hypothetical protein Y695_02300 [Hydrogenophaga sp. T4]|nr:hypothetical protein Y695_02300 [Hydrogenophaga sp. T4]